VDEVLFELLADGVHEYLFGVASRAAADRGPLPSEVARLVGAWRALLACTISTPMVDAESAARDGAYSVIPWAWRGRDVLRMQVAVGYFVRRLPGER
jgi:hypothetical protein